MCNRILAFIAIILCILELAIAGNDKDFEPRPKSIDETNQRLMKQSEVRFLNGFKATLPGYLGIQTPENRLVKNTYELAKKLLDEKRRTEDRYKIFCHNPFGVLPNEIVLYLREHLDPSSSAHALCAHRSFQIDPIAGADPLMQVPMKRDYYFPSFEYGDEYYIKGKAPDLRSLAKRGNFDSIKLLVRSGKANIGMTFIDIKEEEAYYDMPGHLSYEPSYEYEYNLLEWAVEKNNIKLATFLIEMGIDIHKFHDSGVPPVEQARALGLDEMTRLLIKNGAT